MPPINTHHTINYVNMLRVMTQTRKATYAIKMSVRIVYTGRFTRNNS